MYYYLISGLIFIIPGLGMISGLSVAVTVTIFLIANIFICYTNSHFRGVGTKNYWWDATTLKNYKIELLFASWCLLTCFYAINSLNSLFTYCQIFLILLLGFITRIPYNKEKLQYPLIAGTATAIVLFFIEYATHGYLIKLFRSIFQASGSQVFNLYMLDRGCALLSITAWIVIAILLDKHKRYTLMFYILVFYLLSISDNLAGFLGFSVGGIVFGLARINKSVFFRLITIGLIAGSLLTPVIAKKINPQYMATQYSELQISAKHRLYIWHFVANKIMEQPVLKPLFGYGFASSKYIEVKENEIINYKGEKLHPLPLHPHNNILQITLELGIIGLILFLALIYKCLKQIDNLKDDYYRAIAYACFINYFIIGMISYNIWQVWWVATGIWALILIKSLINPKVMIDN